VDALLKAMTTQEKVAQLQTETAQAVPRLGVPGGQERGGGSSLQRESWAVVCALSIWAARQLRCAAAGFQRFPCVSPLVPLCSLRLVGRVPACECRAASLRSLLCLLRQTRLHLHQWLPRPPCPCNGNAASLPWDWHHLLSHQPIDPWPCLCRG